LMEFLTFASQQGLVAWQAALAPPVVAGAASAHPYVKISL
jgi:hypothetical protein